MKPQALHSNRRIDARVPTTALLLAASASLTGCAAIADIFKAGIWVGVLGVVVLVGIVGGAAALLGGR
jgi:hypothetical protein